MYGNDLKIITDRCILLIMSSNRIKRSNDYRIFSNGIIAAYICYIVHAVVVYSMAVKTMGGLSPLNSLKECSSNHVRIFQCIICRNTSH